MSICPVCERACCPRFAIVADAIYFECPDCGCIFINRNLIDQIDAGAHIQRYDDHYWQFETPGARLRSFGASLARVAETILYSRLPITKFIDIGTGAGFLLDALSLYLPASRERFYGVEALPPSKVSQHPNYIRGELGRAQHQFEAGVCIEVIEHLTPKMLRSLVRQLAERSVPGSFYLFNTGLVELVKEVDPGYLDPYRRGHIMSYSLRALDLIFGPAGFTLLPMAGRSWSFCVEFQSEPTSADLVDRIWSPHPDNAAMLHDPMMGSVMRILGQDAARAYH